MKGRLIALLGICIAILIVSGLDTQGKKPDNPGKPDKTQTEWIEFFDEDLIGGEEVVGCCPNAGPYPVYTMTLSSVFGNREGTYTGRLFIQSWAKAYVVHFWTDDVENGFGIEIIGGVIDYDRKTEVTTVTFEDEVCFMCENMELMELDPDTYVPTGVCLDPWISFEGVNFILVREPY